MFGRLIAGLALAWISIVGAWADSTINPLVPADNSSLSSAILRQQFQAAINDINNLAALAGKLQAPVGVVATSDASVDNCGTLNAALQAGSGVYLPAPTDNTNFYYSSCTITVPNGKFLYGEGVSPDNGAGVFGGAAIFCQIAVSPCVRIGGTVPGVDINSRSSEIKNLRIGHWGTNSGTTTVALQLTGGFNTYVDNIFAENSGICILLRTPPGTGTGISVFMEHLRTERCKDVHLWNDSFPEVRIKGSRFGNNNAAGSNAYLRMSCTQNNCTGAGTPNTMAITNSQFNSSGGADVVGTLWDFTSVDSVNGYNAGDYGGIAMSDCHVEQVNHAFQTDSTWPQVKDVKLTNNTIVALLDFFAFNAATNVWRWTIANNNIISFTGFTLNGTPTARPMFQEFVMTGNNIGGNATINGTSNGGGNSTAFFGNNNWENNLTLSGGTWGNLTLTGGSVSGSYTDSATGNVTVFFDRETKVGGTAGITCNAGVSATTGRAKNGILTAC